jgi:ABC-2 type transport system ATP-binding protein
MIKDLLLEQRDKGRTVLMSTHQMHQVEELCDRIVLVDEGVDVLNGTLKEVRKQYANHAVLVHSEQAIPQLPGVVNQAGKNGSRLLTLDEQTTPQDVLAALVAQNIVLDQFEIAVPSLDEIFIKVVEKE